MAPPILGPQQTLAKMALEVFWPCQTNQNPTAFQLSLEKIHQHPIQLIDISPLYAPLLIQGFP